jgi:hypothetical protein
MALTNCTINSQSFTKTGSSVIGSDNAQLAITPNSGYVVSASNFTNNTGSITGISNITLSDSGTPGAIGNTVLVAIDLDDTYVMPSADTTLTIDIDGAADLIQYSLSGQLSSEVSNTTQSAETNVAYSAANTAGQTSQVFQRTFEASANHYFEVEPYFVLTSDNPSRYSITNDKTYTDGRLTEIEFTVDYTFGSENETGDTIVFTAEAEEFFTEVVEITAYSILDSILPNTGETRTINILGTNTAQTKLSISNTAGDTYDFSSDTFTSGTTYLEIAMSSTGVHSENITFPAVSSADTYTFTLDTTAYTNGINSVIDTDTNGIVTFTISQPSEVTVTVRPTHGDARMLISSDKVSQLLSGIDATDSEDANLSHIFEISTVDGPLRILSQPSVSSFTNTSSGSNGGTTINVTSAVLSKIEDKLYLTIAGNVGIVGATNVVSELDLSNNLRIQNKTKAFADSFDCSRNGSVVVSLRSTDTDGDTMTHAIVDNPSDGTLGSLTTNSSVAGPPSELISDVTYTNSGGLLSTDFIKFKANDGVDDSEIETITINVTNSAPIATDQPTGISCERGGSTFANLDVTDADNELDELEYSMITQPLHGFVVLGGDGRFKYKSKGVLSVSEDFFVYEVSDGIDTDQATVTIQITSKPNAIDIEKDCEQGSDTGLIVLRGNSPTNESISYSLITAPTRGSLYYDSGLSNPSGGISTGSLSQHQVFYENDGVSSADDVFQYQVTDNNGLTSRIADVDINVLAPVVSSFYGTPGNPDNTQTTPRGTSIVEIISGTYNDSFPYPFFPTSFSMIVAGSSSSIFKVDARVTTGTLQTTTMEITLWNTSQRAYDEATTGTTAPVRIKHSVAFNHTSTYANPWGTMTVPPGTYFISVKYYSNLNGVANLRFTLT